MLSMEIISMTSLLRDKAFDEYMHEMGTYEFSKSQPISFAISESSKKVHPNTKNFFYL